ncbi:hypothetical protein [Marinomonas pollencensis]|uniref:Nitrogen regulatory protein P-II family n=1 Tax=Marinomonas pollencensis TaxID=491954 RepID=A0A3E0DTA3_9GAMM|nr:hypothetical protein [Marinomonas pollencensis]REG86787.1 hypothetical protein DFP81_101355 [Marinomonas pollencensis]
MSDIIFVDSYRIKVFVIEEFLEKVIASIKEATNLKYGNYDGVLWHSQPGTERCVPRKGSVTYAGEIDGQYACDSIQVQFSIPRERALLEKVVESIFSSHPWDEPVISITETIDTRKNGVI